MINKSGFFSFYFKGIAMGAADVVPGVSGGTMAFILGIYPRLVAALTRFNGQAMKLLFERRFTQLWQYVDGTFLAALFAGILTAIFSLAKLLHHLLDHQPVLVWSFFFGLILASVYFLGKKIPSWNRGTKRGFVIGLVIAVVIGILPATNNPNPSLWFLFFCGTLSICAMILPGISGAFILVLLGAYPAVLEAVHQIKLPILAVLGAGAVCGLLFFSRFLHYLFEHFYELTIAVLTGFIAGSLLKIWPWKAGNLPIFPSQYHSNPQTALALFLMMIGISTIIILEFFGKQEINKQQNN